MFTLLKNYIFDLFLGNVYQSINDFKIKMISFELMIINIYKITGDLDFITYDLIKRNDLLEEENIFLKNKIDQIEIYFKKNQNSSGLKYRKFHPYNLRKKNV
jgi:hypothetical protein